VRAIDVGTREPTAVGRPARTSRTPVLLVTLDVPIVDAAATLAVEAAVEAGRPLVVANVVGGHYLPAPGIPLPTAVVAEDVEASLRMPAELAASLGVATERLRVLTPRPVAALVELAHEREAGLVVLGADPSRVPRRRYAKVVRALHERTTALVWPA
jgi:nucleotide-binding universal stress UspA family protein